MSRRQRFLNPAHAGFAVVLDARFQATTTPVSTWTGRSGTSVNATAGGAVRPAYSATGLNGLPTLVFDGVDDYMDVNALTLFQNQGFGLILAVGVDDASTSGDVSHYFVFTASGSVAASRLSLLSRLTSVAGIFAGSRRLDAGSFSNTGGVGVVTAPCIAVARANWTGNSLIARNSGIQSSSTTFSDGAGSTSNTTANAFRIADDGRALNRLNGRISQVLATNIDPGTPLLRRIEQAAAASFKIPYG